jgi:hypothetical protein
MHYANGRIAKVGDIVKGKGYNIKHEIVGLLTRVSTGCTSCNCEIVCISACSLVYSLAEPTGRHHSPGNHEFDTFFYRGISNSPVSYRVEPTIEYGQCDAFVALDTKTGEVLLPETEDIKTN